MSRQDSRQLFLCLHRPTARQPRRPISCRDSPMLHTAAQTGRKAGSTHGQDQSKIRQGHQTEIVRCGSVERKRRREGYVRGTSCFWLTRDQILLNERKYAEDCLPTPHETSVERSLRKEHWRLRSAESGQACFAGRGPIASRVRVPPHSAKTWPVPNNGGRET